MEENNRQNIPTSCRNQCGFYGSPSFDYFCSKCHRSIVVQREGDQAVDRVSADIPPKISPELLKKTSLPASRSESPCLKNDPPVVTVTNDDSVENKPTLSPTQENLLTPAADLLDEPAADAEVAAAGLPDTLQQTLKDNECKPGSPASTCSSTGETTKKRPSCAVCRKRVGLTGFKCRCGGLFCSTHRYSDVHECSFDYRVSGQEEIRRSNPQVVCEKVQKI